MQYQPQGPSQQQWQGQQQPYNQQGFNPGQQPWGQPQPPQQPPFSESSANNAFNTLPGGKARGIYAVLALITGSLGLHYFYINKPVGGVVTILLVLVTCGCWALVPVIQGILALWTLDNATFYNRFVASPNAFPFF